MADDDLVLEEAEEAMKKSLEALQRDVSRIRTSRANPVLLEGVMVDYYDTPTPLKKLATITAPEPRLLLVQPFDPSGIVGIERAIQKADVGLSPINDGKLLRLPVPELTEERRRELVKTVKKLGEDHKTGVRSARRDANSMLKDMQKDGELPKDESTRAQKKTQELHDAYIEKVDAVITAKEEEILHI